MREEMKRNQQYLQTYKRQGCRVVEVNTRGVTYRGTPWKELGGFGKRKVENLLVLAVPNERTKVIYL